jgi:tellurium resistance protein TerD
MDQPINLKKGGSIDLSKSGLKKIIVGLGWTINRNYKGVDHDLDVSAFLCQDILGNPKLLSNNHFVFYNNLKSPDGAVVHTGDERQGNDDDETDVEQIIVDLEKLDPRIEEISFVVTIDEAKNRRQSFGQVEHAHIRIVNAVNNQELARYTMSNEFKDEIGLQFGSLVKKDSKWEFVAVGAAGPQELIDFVLGYGGTV